MTTPPPNADPSLSATEFAVLRATIAARGTARIALVPATVAVWAALAALLQLSAPTPLAMTFPLAVLAAGFEAVYALHTGVERIGRFIQVYIEEPDDDLVGPGARWETTAMSGGAMPGAGSDPLFTVLFGLAVAANLAAGLLAGVTPLESVALGLAHGGLVLRLVVARRRAGTQRQRDLEFYRRLKASGPR